MQVFITGGTGYVGSALVEHFIAAGYEVAALARSEQSAAKLSRAGATPVPGDLADTAVLEKAAGQADAIVHAAVDYALTEEGVAAELAALEALLRGAAATGPDKPFIFTSTGLVYGFDPAQSRDEDAQLPETSAQPAKAVGERMVREAPAVAGMIMRAGLVYGRGGSLLLSGLIRGAVTSGAATYIGDGGNTWTPVHIDDLARLYVSALKHPVPGIYNAVGPTSFTFRELAEAIADLTGAKPVSITPEQAAAAMGRAAGLLQTSAVTKALKAHNTFDWNPSGPTILDDIRAGSYDL